MTAATTQKRKWHNMAIDSKEKRAGVLGVARPWMRDKFPVATPDEQWRIASGNAYGGNALSPVAGGFQAAWANRANQLL